MLDAEEARASLISIVQPGWHDDAVRRASKLPRSVRPAAEPFLEALPAAYQREVVQAHDRRLREAGAAIDQMSDRDRLRFMSALHPHLGAVLSRWWVDVRSQPYAVGWARRAYRAPANPNLTLPTRARALRSVVWSMGPYDRDAAWLAAWAPHLRSVPGSHTTADGTIGSVLAAAVDMGAAAGADDEVLATLAAIARSEHPIGGMGHHVIVALWRSARPTAWEIVERLLLAAQRQEGLRQAILEAADEAHPVAFMRLLDLVVSHDLTRFAAAVRAAGVWLGVPTDVEQIPEIRSRLTALRRFLGDATACRAALTDGDAWETFLALHTTGLLDVVNALAWADHVALRPSADARAAAVRFIAGTQLSSTPARLLRLVDDPDVDVAALASSHLGVTERNAAEFPADAFERLEGLVGRLGPGTGRSTAATIGIETRPPSTSRDDVLYTMLRVRGDRPLSRLVPWIADMEPLTRAAFAASTTTAGRVSADVRDVLVRLVGDRSSQVRASAVAALDELRVEPGDAPALEHLLTRQATDLRRGVIGLLARQPEDAAVSSARRLWAADGAARRDAACEVLAAVPDTPAVRHVVAELMGDGPTARQRELLGGRLSGADEPTRVVAPVDPLVDPARCTPPRVPQRHARRRSFGSAEAGRILSALDDLAHAHRDTAVTVTTWQGSEDVLVADLQWLTSPFSPRYVSPTDDETARPGMILGHVFRAWWVARPDDCRSAIAELDALQAFAVLQADVRHDRFSAQRPDWWAAALHRLVDQRSGELRHPRLVAHVLEWLIADEITTACIDECVAGHEALLAAVPAAVVEATPPPPDPKQLMGRPADWRQLVVRSPWCSVLNGVLCIRPEAVPADRLAHLLGLARWLDTPTPGADRHRPPGPLVLAAAAAGVATDDDIRDSLLDPRTNQLRLLTRRRVGVVGAPQQRVVELAQELRNRIVAIERTRGDLATEASAAARLIGSISGADLTMELLGRLGKAALVRGYATGSGRDAVYSHLLRVSFPADDDTAVTLRDASTTRRVDAKRLVEFAMFAPQWARLVGESLEWEGFDDAVWWFHAHTKDDRWGIDKDVRDVWAALSAERTPLSADDLVGGAVDFAWFQRAHATLGAQRWTTLHGAARLAAGGNGHRRAQLFAEAMLGIVGEQTLRDRITATRHQDSVRALGLVPLPADEPDRTAVTLDRYLTLRSFERGSAAFGSQRQASERTAVRIGIENLARSAGFADPQRFIWSMEAAEAGDLADGPVSVTEDDLTVALSVDDDGQAQLQVTRDGRPLKAVPAKQRTLPSIAGLRDRKAALTRQAARVRSSLESAMVREERFSADDLAVLDRHPVVAPMLRRMVVVDEVGQTMRRTVEGFVGADLAAVEPVGSVRLAHPLDLARSGHWAGWQELVVTEARRQPVKQVFRELYVLTDAERASGPVSRRYAGHQLQPRQALALLGRRGWLHDRDTGDVSRVFHHHGVVARAAFVNGFLTPAEVELPTLDVVAFTKQGEYLAQPINTIPPVVFSEAMRDLDLVVSVAHAGGVDPETTASTVEMRAALVRETVRLSKLDNVRLLDAHVLIDGSLGEYSVHLGSGVVHRRPGGAVCIIPVDSQRRGRIFLPFADDDPKTAEIVAKILLLARDRQIKDPTILDQLRSA